MSERRKSVSVSGQAKTGSAPKPFVLLPADLSRENILRDEFEMPRGGHNGINFQRCGGGRRVNRRGRHLAD
jgi:hypothetical protein